MKINTITFPSTLLLAAANTTAAAPTAEAEAQPAAAAEAAVTYCNTYKTFTGSKGFDAWLSVRGGSKACIIYRGADSDGVYILQTTLNSKCYNYKIDEDGIFGAETEAALKKAQRKWGAEPDGVYGPETRDKIQWDVYNKSGSVSCLKLSQT